VTSCNVVVGYRCFGGSYCLYVQDFRDETDRYLHLQSNLLLLLLTLDAREIKIGHGWGTETWHRRPDYCRLNRPDKQIFLHMCCTVTWKGNKLQACENRAPKNVFGPKKVANDF